jgi:hypothetical protein
MYNSKTLRLRNSLKERSLIWQRSRLPVGDDGIGIPRFGNGTVSVFQGGGRWSALTRMITDSQSCSSSTGRGSGEAVGTHQHKRARNGGRGDVADLSGEAKNRGGSTAFASHHVY